MENENWGEDLISLLDEDGVESEYRIIACAELDGVEYMALEPIGQDPEEALMEAAQLVFLRLSEELDEDGEQYLESIQDEEEFDRVAEIFRDKLSEEYEFLEDDGEEQAPRDKSIIAEATLLCASVPLDMIQHILLGSPISVRPDCRPPTPSGWKKGA